MIKKYNQFNEKIKRFWKILPTSETHFKAALKKINVPDKYSLDLIDELRSKKLSYDYPWYRGSISINNRRLKKMPEEIKKQFKEDWHTPDKGIFIINDTINGYDRWDCLTKDELDVFFNKRPHRYGVYNYEGYIHLTEEELKQIDVEEKSIKYNI